MPTPNERRALLFVATLAALGLGARAVRGHLAARADREAGNVGAVANDAASAALDRQIVSVDSATAAKRSRAGAGSKSRAKRPAARGAAPAGAADSSATPPRNERGPAPRAMQGPPPRVDKPEPRALYEANRLAVAERNRAVQARIEADRAERARAPAGPVALPGAPAPSSPARPAAPSGANAGSGRRVDLDTAGPDELAALPWVGPALAARIVSDRAIRGPFGSLAALQRVRGVGPGLVARIAPFVTFSRPDSRPPEVIRFRPLRAPPPRP